MRRPEAEAFTCGSGDEFPGPEVTTRAWEGQRRMLRGTPSTGPFVGTCTRAEGKVTSRTRISYDARHPAAGLVKQPIENKTEN